MEAKVHRRLIDDAGEKIAGARKDWKTEALSSDDLSRMTAEEVVIETKKDNVWTKPDWEAVVAAGMDREAAAYVKIVRDRMAQEPKPRRGADPVTLRRAFVDMTSEVRDVFMACRTVHDVRGAYGTIRARYGKLRGDDPESTRFFSVYKARTCPFALSFDDMRKAAKMLDEGFPAKVPSWRKGVILRTKPDGTVRLVKGHKVVGEGFPGKEEALAWLERNHRVISAKASAAEEAGAKRDPDRPHLSRVRRDGLAESPRGGRDVTPEEFIETFGFRGVQFGNWLPDDERQTVLNMGYDAVWDLAETLGWEPKYMSLGGTLAVAFGARGKGGKAAAHYEAGQRIVNMTRLSGAGTLAHEFGHALDHWTGCGSKQAAGIPSASGWRGAPNVSPEPLMHRGEEAAAAWVEVMTSLLRTPVSRDARATQIKEQIDSLEKKLAANETGIARALERDGRRRSHKLIKDAMTWSENTRQRLVAMNSRLAEVLAAPEGSTHGFEPSRFLREAAKISGPSGEYWKRPTELFARAFEAWVHDEIDARGGRSQYLVSGVAEGLFAGDEYKGDPYPAGEERRRINAAMARMAEAMRPEAEFADSPDGTPAFR